MKLFSLNWFKSKKQQKSKIIKEELSSEIDSYQIKKNYKPLEKPYKNIKLVNDNLTIVLNNGDVISKMECTMEDFLSCRNAVTENDLFRIISSPEIIKQKEEEEKQREKTLNIIKSFNTLNDLNDFEIKNNETVYLKGINRSLPQLVVEKFIDIIIEQQYYTGFGDLEKDLLHNVEYQSLKKFALKCFLNPNAQSAEDLYEFLNKHQFKIDRHGNFYAYRRVVSKDSPNKALVEFVSNTYTKIKAVWKKNVKNYYVWLLNDGTYTFNKQSKPCSINKLIGNLKELYLELPTLQENSYTSAHTGKEDYRIGEIISMPRNEGDDNNNISCSKGFHASSKEYDYSGFGNTPILMIISPSDVLAVPKGEIGKLRTSAWFFACTLSEDEKYILDDEDFSVEELGDVFEEKYQKNLLNKVNNSFVEEVKRHTFNIPTINNKEIEKIVKSLKEMKNDLDNRIVKI